MHKVTIVMKVTQVFAHMTFKLNDSMAKLLSIRIQNITAQLLIFVAEYSTICVLSID